MIFGFNKCKSDKELQDIFLGSGSYTIRISNQYITERDEEGTVMIYPKGSECITLRIDVLSYSPKDETIEPTTGYDYVVRDADSKKKKLYYENDLAIAFNESTSVENGINLIMKFWEIGPRDNRIIIMSCTILEEKQNDKRVKKLLASIPGLIKSIEPTEKHDSIETSSGVVNYTTTKREPADQEIQELAKNDKEFIKTWFSNGCNIILYYKPNFKQTNLSFGLLDSVFIDWLNDKNGEKFSSDSIANGLGVVFGELLSRELTMDWIKVIDGYGDGFGVRALDNFTSFPISSVHKRIETGETGFFTNIYEMLKHAIDKKKNEI